MILWDDNLVQIDSPMILYNSITTRIMPCVDSQPWMLSTVYGPHEDQHKTTFIEEIKLIHSLINELWLMLGDFNLIYRACDKKKIKISTGGLWENSGQYSTIVS